MPPAYPHSDRAFLSSSPSRLCSLSYSPDHGQIRARRHEVVLVQIPAAMGSRAKEHQPRRQQGGLVRHAVEVVALLCSFGTRKEKKSPKCASLRGVGDVVQSTLTDLAAFGGSRDKGVPH